MLNILYFERTNQLENEKSREFQMIRSCMFVIENGVGWQLPNVFIGDRKKKKQKKKNKKKKRRIKREKKKAVDEQKKSFLKSNHDVAKSAAMLQRVFTNEPYNSPVAKAPKNVKRS